MNICGGCQDACSCSPVCREVGHGGTTIRRPDRATPRGKVWWLDDPRVTSLEPRLAKVNVASLQSYAPPYDQGENQLPQGVAEATTNRWRESEHWTHSPNRYLSESTDNTRTPGTSSHELDLSLSLFLFPSFTIYVLQVRIYDLPTRSALL